MTHLLTYSLTHDSLLSTHGSLTHQLTPLGKLDVYGQLSADYPYPYPYPYP